MKVSSAARAADHPTIPPIAAAAGFVTPTNWDLKSAYDYCARITYGHYENFPVASLAIPKTLRPHVTAIYAFARAADDFADEAEFADQRMQLLRAWGEELEHCDSRVSQHPVFLALGETIRRTELPKQLLRDLLTAFRMDVDKRQYADFQEVMHYCRHSANPVGRLIMHLFGYSEQRLLELSDLVCSGLQLANFWQDVSVDLRKPRVYLPQDEIIAHGYDMQRLQAGVYDDAFRRLMVFQVERAERMLTQGSAIVDGVRGRLRLELALTCSGGLRVLQKIRRLNYNVLARRPHLHAGDKIGILLATLWRIR